MSVFTQLEIQPLGDDKYQVIMARPWWKPQYHHRTHLAWTPLTGMVLFLRLAFYNPTRPRIGETFKLTEMLKCHQK